MSIYSELLRLALDEEQRACDVALCSFEELVEELVQRQLELLAAREELGPSSTRAAEWTADLITQDVALVRVCQRLGIHQVLAEPSAPPTERDRLLSVLASRRVNLNPSVRSE